jgi:hypothetical protein
MSESLLFVMVFAGDNNNLIRKSFIDETMFLSNSARPMPRHIPFKRFRLARPMKRVSRNFGNQLIDFTKNLYVFFDPFFLLGEGGFRKTNHYFILDLAQAMASSSVAKVIIFPCSISRIDFSRCSRFAGELKRYSVSSCSLTVISTFWSGYASFKEVIKLASSSLVLSLNTASIPVIIAETRKNYQRRYGAPDSKMRGKLREQ